MPHTTSNGVHRTLHHALAVGLALAATALAPNLASAQATMTSQAALAALPDPDRYRLELSNDGLSPQQRQDLGRMMIDTIGEEHFFGAIYAFLPKDSKQLSIHLRRQLHSLEAAGRSALKDCEAARRDGDAACVAIGRIVPENWDEQSAPTLSHEAMFAFSKNAGAMEGPKFVARSRDTTAWAMWSGADTRQRALDECNQAVEAGGFAPDCDIVIGDAP